VRSKKLRITSITIAYDIISIISVKSRITDRIAVLRLLRVIFSVLVLGFLHGWHPFEFRRCQNARVVVNIANGMVVAVGYKDLDVLV
jgi:hypothetical protein